MLRQPVSSFRKPRVGFRKGTLMQIVKIVQKTTRWAVITDDSGTYAAFNTKAEANEWSNQFCPMGADGEGDMNVLLIPETHGLIEAMGWTERER